MASYNKINGIYGCDNKYLLTDILRKEWGFDGLVVSDWGAVNDRVHGIRAGMDLEMPSLKYDTDEEIVAAVKDGSLSQEELDLCAQRVTELILKGQEQKTKPGNQDKEHHALAREIAGKSAVLLKNTDHILPICPTAKTAVIGQMAKKPRYQGAGSSRINPAFLDNAYDALKAAGVPVSYADGYMLGSKTVDEAQIREACELAKNSDIVLLFAGLPEEYESEGFDRTSLDMPESHNRLIEEVAKINPNTIVILQLGAPVLMPWKDSVKGILLMYLAGQAGGSATADLLLGKVNPSGKLAETFPAALQDNSSYSFPGTPKSVQYRESIYVGYRYYDTVKQNVMFPFGYGLSYTTFEYSNLEVEELGPMSYKVSVDVTNTGKEAGAEVVQLYVHCAASKLFRAEKELKGFGKLYLKPGECKKLTMTLDQRSFAYYNTKAKDWCVEGGSYDLLIGASSADIRLKASLTLTGDGKEILLTEQYQKLSDYIRPSYPLRISNEQFISLLGYTPKDDHFGKPYDRNSNLTDIKDTLIGKILCSVVKKSIRKMSGGASAPDPTTTLMMERSVMEMPLRSMKMATGLTNHKIDGIVELANGHFFRGIRMLLSK